MTSQQRRRTAVKVLQRHHLTAAANVIDDNLLQVADGSAQVVGHRRQFDVPRLQHLHLLLQGGDAFQLPVTALGRRQAVSRALPAELDAFLMFHVYRRDRRRVHEARRRRRQRRRRQRRRGRGCEMLTLRRRLPLMYTAVGSAVTAERYGGDVTVGRRGGSDATPVGR